MDVFEYTFTEPVSLHFIVAADTKDEAQKILQITDTEFEENVTLCEDSELCTSALAVPKTILYKEEDNAFRELDQEESVITIHLKYLLKETRAA